MTKPYNSVVIKLQNLDGDKTQKLKLWINSKNIAMTKPNREEKIRFMWEKLENYILTKLKQ